MSTTGGPSSETLSQVGVARHCPAAAVLTLIALFFSGHPALAAIVAPPVNRELGVLEHLQLVPLFAMSVWGAAAWRRERTPVWRWFFLAMSGGALLLALEEMNYGQHYLALLTGTGSEGEIGPRNLHNIGDPTDWLKRAGDVGTAALFVVVPLIQHEAGGRPRQRGAPPPKATCPPPRTRCGIASRLQLHSLRVQRFRTAAHHTFPLRRRSVAARNRKP